MTGQTLGHYRILEKIGEGGMGAVYRAEDTRLGRIVALKVLSAERVADPQRLPRFLQEARLASSLNHPNIATILDVGEADGQHYIAMEFVEGEGLRERIRGQALPLAALLDLAMQIADALTEANRRGIVHRDIKGDNIRITPQGRVKMLDFGLAKHLPQTGDATETLVAARTETGVIMGTVTYMSPEQALGQPVDARSDLFSFGVVLYEMATGRMPFTGNSPTSTIDKILHNPPPAPAQFNSELPPALEQVILKLLEKNAEYRYQSAREVLVDLRRLKRALDTGSLAAVRVDGRRVAPASRRRRILYAAIVLLAFAAGALVHRWGFQPPARANRRFSTVTNFAGVEAQPSFSPDGRSVAFVSDRGGQYDIWVSLIGAGSLVRITNDPNFKFRPRWSPDGNRIAYARLNESGLPDIWVVPALGGTPRKLLPEAADPAWSPDSRSLAYADHATDTIWVADANGSNNRAVTKEEAMWLHVQPAFSRDGQRLAFVRRAGGPYGQLMISDLATGKSHSLTDHSALVLSPAWSADGRWIYFASSRGGTVNIWKVAASGGPPEQITAGQGEDVDLDISADGKRIVFSTPPAKARKQKVFGSSMPMVRIRPNWWRMNA